MHIGDLRNKDIFDIAAACKPLRRCAHMAYNSLHFQLDMTTGMARGMSQLQHSLMRVLEEGRGYPTHILRITFFAARLSGPSVDASSLMERDESPFAPEGYSEEHLVTLALSDIDYQLSQLVSPDMTPSLDTFILDASATGQLLPFLTTFEVLARDRQRRFVELGRFFSEDPQLSRAFLCQPVDVCAHWTSGRAPNQASRGSPYSVVACAPLRLRTPLARYSKQGQCNANRRIGDPAKR